jgi:acyl-CoA thioesterase
MSDPATELARRCAEVMYAEDHAARHLGISVSDVMPGRAKTGMTVDERMINSHAICHGGIIFLLADTAFAYACNTYNQISVAQHCTISFLAPGRLGDRLTAVAVERARQGRGGIYDITVTNQDGKLIAEFRGNARSLRGELLPAEDSREGEAP